jgi:hypothetical protein
MFRLFNSLLYEFDMSDSASTLHDANNRGLGLKLPIHLHRLVCLLVFLLRLLQLDLVDLDSELRRREPCVDLELVRLFDLAALGRFHQDAHFTARQRLQRALQLRVREAGRSLQVAVMQGSCGAGRIVEGE